ncbi:MAG: hypothetical protein Q7T03_11025 [Deltaproteobacteria bacterium]|nr:hypothetical protein [Deltaproteobacteria bacterium]
MHWLLFILMAVLSLSCGSVSESVSGSSSTSSEGIAIVINNPDPNAGDAGKSFSTAKELSVGKAARASLNSCSLTMSASGETTQSQTTSVASDASSVTFSGLSITKGKDWAFAVDCFDSSQTTNNIPVGFHASKTASIPSSGSATVSMDAEFVNLIADGSADCYYVRINQETSTDTLITIGFASALNDTQKASLRVVLEIDTTTSLSSPGVIDVAQSDGLTTASKTGPYFVITGGLTGPRGGLFDRNDNELMSTSCVWSSDSTEAKCSLGIRQMKGLVDSDQSGQWVALCSLTGANPWDRLPDTGFAQYDLSLNTSDSDVSSLAANGSACTPSRNGADCQFGKCTKSGVCISLTPVTLAQDVTHASGQGGFAFGDGSATSAYFATPGDVAVALDGSAAYVADTDNHAIRKIDFTLATTSPNYVTTIVGTGLGVSGTTNGACASASFNGPVAVVVNPSNDTLYVADNNNFVIRKIALSPCTVSTFAGMMSTSGTVIEATGTSARFGRPVEMVIDSKGENLYVSDSNNAQILKVTIPGAVVTVVAGSGANGSADGTGTAATFYIPNGTALDCTETNLFVADGGNSALRKINLATGAVTTLLNSGLAGIQRLVIDPVCNNLYGTFTTGTQGVKKIVISSGAISTVAGSGSTGYTNGNGTSAQFSSPTGIAISPDGSTIYVAEQGNQMIRKIQ